MTIETVPSNETTVEQGGSVDFTAKVLGLSTILTDPQPAQNVNLEFVCAVLPGVSIANGVFTVDSEVAGNAQR